VGLTVERVWIVHRHGRVFVQYEVDYEVAE
jgi:hypothetical protein